MVPALLVLLGQQRSGPSDRRDILAVNLLPYIDIWIIVGRHVDVNPVAAVNVVGAGYLIDDGAVMEHTGPEHMLAVGIKRYRALIGDLRAVRGRRLAAVGGIDNHRIAVAGRETRRNGVFIFATGQVDRGDGIVQGTGIGRRHVLGHAVIDAEEHVAGDAHDVGRLGRVIAIAQYQIDSAGIHHGTEPGHSANHHAVIIVILPAGETAGQTVVVVIKGINPGQSATVILDIDHDVVTAGAAVHHIITRDDAARAHLAIGQHAHLERRRAVKRQLHARGVGNLFAIGIGLAAVGRIDQHGALGRRLHGDGYRCIVVAAAPVDDRIAIDQILLDVAVHQACQRRCDAQATRALGVAPHLGEALGSTHANCFTAQLQVQFTVFSGHTPRDAVITRQDGVPGGTLVGDAGSATGLDKARNQVMPHGVHEVGIEQARRARHGQDEAVGLDNLIVDAMHIVAVAGIGGQVLERVVVVDEGDGITLETVVPDEAVILEQAETLPAQVIERLPDLLLQGEVERGTLEAALVIDTLDPLLDVARCAPELAHRECGPYHGVVVSEMLGLEATGVVIAEADVAQLILEVAQIGELLLLRGGAVVVNVTSPGALAGIATAVGVAAAHATLIIPADVPTPAIPVPVPLDTVGLARCRSDNVNLIHEVVGVFYIIVPCAQATLVIGHHVLHGTRSGGLVSTDEVNQLGFGTKIAFRIPCPAIDLIGLATAMVQVEHGHKAHTVGVVDHVTVSGANPRAVVAGAPGLALGSEHRLVGAHGGTALREPQQVDVGGNVVLLVQQLGPGGHGKEPLVVLAPSGTIHRGHRLVCVSASRAETVPEETLQHNASIVRRPALGRHGQRRHERH